MSRFIDDQYEGVVINLPLFFIEVNNLKPLLDKFMQDLEDSAKLSTMLPDYTNSLYELENYASKRGLTKAKNEQLEKIKVANTLWVNRRVNREVLDTCWIPIVDTFSTWSDIQIGNVTYLANDMWKPKCKRASKKKIKEMNDALRQLDLNNIIDFIEGNSLYQLRGLTRNLTYGTHWQLSKTPIYENNYGDISIRIEILGVHYWADNTGYTKHPLRNNQFDLQFECIRPGNKSATILLKDYTLSNNGMLLTKNKNN